MFVLRGGEGTREEKERRKGRRQKVGRDGKREGGREGREGPLAIVFLYYLKIL